MAIRAERVANIIIRRGERVASIIIRRLERVAGGMDVYAFYKCDNSELNWNFILFFVITNCTFNSIFRQH
jgi:hypothetical protein